MTEFAHSTKVNENLITLDEVFESTNFEDETVVPKTHILTKCGLTSWNLKFDGQSDVRDFVSSVEELLTARGISEQLLLANFHDLLAEPVLTWFRVNRYQITSWFCLRTLLFENFLPTDYAYQITSQLRAKKQLENQFLLEFVSQMRFLANKIPNVLPESDFFEIIKHNILPKYHAALVFGSVYSVSDLLKVGKLADAYSSSIVNNSVNNPVYSFDYSPKSVVRSTYQPSICAATSVNTPRPKTAMLCFMCKQPGHFSKQCPSRTETDLICFKCQQSGHLYKNCPNIKIPICLKCRTLNCTNKTCPHCNANPKPASAPAMCAATKAKLLPTTIPAATVTAHPAAATTPAVASTEAYSSSRGQRQPKQKPKN